MLGLSPYARRVFLAVAVLVVLNAGVALGAPSGDRSPSRSLIDKVRGAIVHILEDYRVIWPPG